MSVPSARADALAARAGERALDLLLVTDLVGVRWLTGFTGSNALAILGTGEDAPARIVLTDFRYVTQIAEQVDDSWDRRQAKQELIGPALADHLPEAGGERLPRVGFDDRSVTVSQLDRIREAIGERVELVAAGGLVEDLREIKDAGEVGRIREAAQLADAALLEVLERGLAGRTEAAVALDLEMAMRRRGAEAISFTPIVASGAHGALPHAEPRAVEIPAGVLVTIDWGAQLDGYCSDCTRTYATVRSTRSRSRSTASCWRRRSGRWPPCGPGPPAARSTPWRGRSSRPRAMATTSVMGSGTVWASRSTKPRGSRSWLPSRHGFRPG